MFIEIINVATLLCVMLVCCKEQLFETGKISFKTGKIFFGTGKKFETDRDFKTDRIFFELGISFLELVKSFWN